MVNLKRRVQILLSRIKHNHINHVSVHFQNFESLYCENFSLICIWNQRFKIINEVLHSVDFIGYCADREMNDAQFLATMI